MRARRAGAFRRALAALIGGRVGVGIVRQVAGEAIDVGHGGEALRGDPLRCGRETARLGASAITGVRTTPV